MNWIVRLWGAMGFALRAFPYHWRHGEDALMSLRVDSTAELEEVATGGASSDDAEIDYVTAVLDLPPAVAPAPEALPTGYVTPVPDNLSGMPPQFKIWTVVDGAVCYEGDQGIDARRCIEALRATGVEWASERDGKPWDRGPR